MSPSPEHEYRTINVFNVVNVVFIGHNSDKDFQFEMENFGVRVYLVLVSALFLSNSGLGGGGGRQQQPGSFGLN